VIIKKQWQCDGRLESDPQYDGYTQVWLKAGRSFYSDPDPNPQGNTEWFVCGAGAKAMGFRPQQWVAKVDGVWYLRYPGGGDRGQYRKTKNSWMTGVRQANEQEAALLDAATIE
jgi:hypothetical protein